MFFNSLDFVIFLPVVFLLYWFVFNSNRKYQNIFLVVASYVFYGWWDWRFLGLIVLSSLVDYFIGLKMADEVKGGKRKILLILSLFVNLGILIYFKYFNFFIESFVDAFTYFGITFKPSTLQIVLPVGISFYTFQTLSYSIDVYRRKLGPTKDIVSFFAYVSFFPQLVAGPIERAKHLLPQFFKPRVFNYEIAVSGMRLTLWGFFQKIVIADGCALYVNDIFTNYQSYSSPILVLGAVLFSFQIYGDFAGYSNVAIGVSRLFGFDLMQNFKYPYFSRDIAEFWRRWHISLSTWFRDYLYIPLGGSRGSKIIQVRNVFIIFIVSGFWHGANWTFIVWGALNAIFFLPLILLEKNRKYTVSLKDLGHVPDLKTLINVFATFTLTTFAWVFFRSNSIADAINYLKRIILNSDYTSLSSNSTMNNTIWPLFIFIGFFVTVEWLNRDSETVVSRFLLERKFMRYSFYFLIIILIIININNEASGFIYFQF
jgi:D-alanyl-lipoteichoic acid acyltransferase DltB (MBOAT superfamily)